MKRNIFRSASGPKSERAARRFRNASAAIPTSQPVPEQFLRDNAAKGIIDYHIRAYREGEGVSIYMHAANADSDTLDFDVMGDNLVSCNTLRWLIEVAMESK